MNVTEQGKAMKALEDMNLIDDFLFGEVMADEECGLEACRIILSCVLKREVRNITFTAQKSVPGVSETSHGIRMDVYVTEEPDQTGESIRVYDVEPDKLSDRRESLPRRSRYYGGLIDTQLLNTGIDYEKLPDLVSIFILSYDPFGENALYYEAGTVVKTHPNVEYDDGVKRIFLYVKGKLPEDAGDDERRLQNLLRYINDSKDENVTDDNTDKLNNIVRHTKNKPGMGIKYMKSWERDRELIRDERRRTEEAEQRAEEEKQRAEKEKQRAEKEKQRADELQSELDAAKAELARLKNDRV